MDNFLNKTFIAPPLNNNRFVALFQTEIIIPTNNVLYTLGSRIFFNETSQFSERYSYHMQAVTTKKS